MKLSLVMTCCVLAFAAVAEDAVLIDSGDEGAQAVETLGRPRPRRQRRRRSGSRPLFLMIDRNTDAAKLDEIKAQALAKIDEAAKLAAARTNDVPVRVMISVQDFRSFPPAPRGKRPPVPTVSDPVEAK